MVYFPKKCVVDTNVPITANLHTKPRSKSKVPNECIEQCVDAVLHVMEKGGLVLDVEGVIFDEYIRKRKESLSFRGQPGMGDAFLKWIYDNQWKSEKVDRVNITKCGENYVDFPDHPGLTAFDEDDRKFVAVANAHQEKPPILQATDSKWWGWKDALQDSGITVMFLCPEYVKNKYCKKR